MAVLCSSEDTLLEHTSQCKRASPDYSSSEEDTHNFKRLKTTSDLLIVFHDEDFTNDNNNDTHIVHTDTVLLQQFQLPTTSTPELEYLESIESSWITSLLDSDRSPIATLEFSFIDDGFSIEGGFLYVPLDNLPLSPLKYCVLCFDLMHVMHLLFIHKINNNPFFNFKFMSTHFCLFVLHNRPQEIQVRETASYCLWQSLRMDPSTPVVLAKYVDTNCNGANFRSQLWQTRKVVRHSLNVGMPTILLLIQSPQHCPQLHTSVFHVVPSERLFSLKP
jgi:hypothetical protein